MISDEVRKQNEMLTFFVDEHVATPDYPIYFCDKCQSEENKFKRFFFELDVYSVRMKLEGEPEMRNCYMCSECLERARNAGVKVLDDHVKTITDEATTSIHEYIERQRTSMSKMLTDDSE
tara:strand:+ start:157 stop:516 length:360 start_codon:yes stop_codon:yes gene_type:complete